MQGDAIIGILWITLGILLGHWQIFPKCFHRQESPSAALFECRHIVTNYSQSEVLIQYLLFFLWKVGSLRGRYIHGIFVRVKQSYPLRINSCVCGLSFQCCA